MTQRFPFTSHTTVNGIFKVVQCTAWVAKQGGPVLRGRACSRWQILPRKAPASVEPGTLGTQAWEKKEGCLLFLPSACNDMQLIWKWACQLEIQINAAFIHYFSGPSSPGSGLHLFCLAVSKHLWASDQRLWGRKTGEFQRTNPSEGLKKGSY